MGFVIFAAICSYCQSVDDILRIQTLETDAVPYQLSLEIAACMYDVRHLVPSNMSSLVCKQFTTKRRLD